MPIYTRITRNRRRNIAWSIKGCYYRWLDRRHYQLAIRRFLIPVDNKVGKEYKPDTEAMVVNSDEIPDGWMGLDIGPKTQQLFADAVKDASTVIWNGPMGVSEWDNFAAGTIAVATAIADSNAISIIGGGDSAAAIQKLGFADKMSHISTGGGASLEYLEGKELPGIAALNDKK